MEEGEYEEQKGREGVLDIQCRYNVDMPNPEGWSEERRRNEGVEAERSECRIQ